MANQQNDSMVEGLKKLSSQFASLMLMPDADIDFLTQLQIVIRNKVLAAAADAAHGQALNAAGAVMGAGAGAAGPGGPQSPPGPGIPGPGASGSIPGPAPIPGPGPIGGGYGGGAAGIPTPNPDELRRVLSGGM